MADTTTTRAAASAALATYEQQPGFQNYGPDREEAILDLMADLAHLADALGLSGGRCLDSAAEHYRAEEGEFDDAQPTTPRQPTCADRIDDHLAGRLASFRALTTAADAASWTDVDVEALKAEDIITSENVPGHYGEANRVEELTIDDLNERARERIYEYPLGVSTSRVWRVDLSTGGPADWLEFTTDDDADVTAVRYHFSDWFDHAETRLEGDDAETAAAFGRALTADFYAEGQQP